MTRPIFLLSDFGTAETYVGQVKAVLAGIAPRSLVVDLTHDVAPFAVDQGAWMLETAMDVLPAGALVMAVVDPGVGTARRPIVVRSGSRLFVGPDNGILSPAFPEQVRECAASEGLTPLPADAGAEVRELCSPYIRRPHVSATFHGRDIFAPAAGHLAAGLPWEQAGPPCASAVVLPAFRGYAGPFGELHGRVIRIDRFGNLVTTIRTWQLFPSFELCLGNVCVDRHVYTFADAPRGMPFCHADSSGFVAVALNQGSAAAALDARVGDPVVLRAR